MSLKGLGDSKPQRMENMLGLLGSGDASFLFIQLFLWQLPQLVRTARLPGISRGSRQDTAGILAAFSTVCASHTATVPTRGSDIFTIAILARRPSAISRLLFLEFLNVEELLFLENSAEWWIQCPAGCSTGLSCGKFG